MSKTVLITLGIAIGFAVPFIVAMIVFGYVDHDYFH
jgi:hypothetical protein